MNDVHATHGSTRTARVACLGMFTPERNRLRACFSTDTVNQQGLVRRNLNYRGIPEGIYGAIKQCSSLSLAIRVSKSN